MKTERQRSVKTDTVIKWRKFLMDLSTLIEERKIFSPSNLARAYGIDQVAARVALLNNFIQKGVQINEWEKGANFGSNTVSAKKLIELVRLYKIDNKKKNAIKIAKSETRLISDDLSNDNSNSAEEYIPEIKSANTRQLEGIVKRALGANQNMNPSSSLFTENEKEFDDKLKIACAIGSAIYVNNSESYYEDLNNIIVEFTNDLYDKLKKNK